MNVASLKVFLIFFNCILFDALREVSFFGSFGVGESGSGSKERS